MFVLSNFNKKKICCKSAFYFNLTKELKPKLQDCQVKKIKENFAKVCSEFSKKGLKMDNFLQHSKMAK
jgi:hypothetical protein